MIKILFLIPNLGQGGAEKVLVNLVNNMDTSVFDITVHSIFDGGVNKQFLKSKIKFKTTFKHQFRGNSILQKFFSPRFLFKLLIDDEYDIIVSYLEGVTARIVSGCSNNKIKLISWIHVEQFTKKCASSSFRNYNEALDCYSKYDQIVCVSEHVKKDFLSIFNVSNRINVLYNTNESEQIIKFGKEDIDIKLDHNYVNLCAIGTLKESKGFDRLIRIVSRLNDSYLNVRLYILGKGPLKKNLENQIKKLHLENNVFFLGYQTNPYKYLSKMDVFTCASYAEGFSTAATESLILGIPVVTVSVSGMYEMLGYNNEYGIVTENDEDALFQGLKRLISDRKLLKFYEKKAKERGTFFSTKNTVESTEKCLRDVLKNNY